MPVSGGLPEMLRVLFMLLLCCKRSFIRDEGLAKCRGWGVILAVPYDVI